MTDLKKKLIEVALPLDAINAASAREKSIRHGHPSTLHLWWARRPLAACRAVLFAQLVDDPSAHPDQFPTEEDQDRERERLFRIIEELVLWENTTNEEVLERARAEIRRSCDGNPPPILDPFAGGGSIPLEAQRLGLEAHASDLNPVAVLINKALIEIPPKWADRPPVHPDSDRRMTWKGSEGLAEDVGRYGQWLREEAEKRVGHLYPEAILPSGRRARVIAWIWARTIPCENPACGVDMPLVRSFWLSKRGKRRVWIVPKVDGRELSFEVELGTSGPAIEGTVERSGATCLVCAQTTSLSYVREQAKRNRMGRTPMAVVAQVGRSREYFPISVSDPRGIVSSLPEDLPSQEVPTSSHDVDRLPMYGMRLWVDAFTDRQLSYLGCVRELLHELRVRIQEDAGGGDGDSYAISVCTYVGLAASRLIDQLNALARWSPSRDQSIGLFARHAIPMVWDFPEVSPFSGAAGDLSVGLRNLVKVIAALPIQGTARVEQMDARRAEPVGVVATDPPYYDNVGYADLSDFFYVWLRYLLGPMHPALMATMESPKAEELIASVGRHGSQREAEEFFESGFMEVFRSVGVSHAEALPMTLFYAFKQAESGGAGMVSTGWATMLEGLASAGWMVTATWPIRTERSGRTIAVGTNALASSVLLACRRRPPSAGLIDRRAFIRALAEGLQGPLRDLQKANVAPVDLRQAALGPGMAIYSSYSRVVEPDGTSMRVQTALGLINQVLDQALDEQTADFDAQTRWATQWLASYWFDEGPYGMAEQLAVAMNIAVSSMVDSGILVSGRGRVRLLGFDDLPADWGPASDDQTPVWEATHHLVKRLQDGGEAAAGQLARQLGGVAGAARNLAYHLYTICERPKPKLAGPYNALVASWPEIQRLAQQEPAPSGPEQQSFDA